MKAVKIALGILLCGAIVFSAGCASGASSAATAQNQTSTVKRGNIAINVTSTGNLALSRTEDCAFEMAGTIEEVFVKAGDSVTEGQELVKLDTTDWDKQVKNLDKALVTAQRNLTSMESNVAKAERNVAARERDLAKVERTVPAAESQVIGKQYALKQAELNLEKARLTYETFSTRTELDEVEKKLKLISIDIAAKAIDDARVAVEDAQQAVKDAQQAVKDGQQAVEDARQAVKDAQANLKDAQQAVTDAQTALDDAKALSPAIKTPFTGFITKVNVKGGDTVQKGTVALQLADPEKFEVSILVSEQDISTVKLDSLAAVQIDSLKATVPARVTYIAPTATISQGVVNYSVTVQVQSLQPAQPGSSGATQGASSNTGQSQGVPSITSLPQGTTRVFQGAPTSTGVPQAAQSSQTVTLKQGLSTTVTIPILSKTNVLLVPNRAISRQGKDTVVQVMKNGAAETRVITTGVSDLQNTEATSGLSEGEEVVIPQSTSTSTGLKPAGGMFIR